VVAVFSLVIYFVAIASRLPEAEVDVYVRDVYPRRSADRDGRPSGSALAERAGPRGSALLHHRWLDGHPRSWPGQGWVADWPG